jgi:hypothetical protein
MVLEVMEVIQYSAHWLHVVVVEVEVLMVINLDLVVVQVVALVVLLHLED